MDKVGEDTKSRIEQAGDDLSGPASSIYAEASGDVGSLRNKLGDYVATASDEGVAKASSFLGDLDNALASATNALDDATDENDEEEEDDGNAGAIPSVAVAMVGLIGGFAVFANL